MGWRILASDSVVSASCPVVFLLTPWDFPSIYSSVLESAQLSPPRCYCFYNPLWLSLLSVVGGILFTSGGCVV